MNNFLNVSFLAFNGPLGALEVINKESSVCLHFEWHQVLVSLPCGQKQTMRLARWPLGQVGIKL